MLTQPLVVARKELVDHVRDVRTLGLNLLYTLMGPAIVLLLLLRGLPAPDGSGGSGPLPVMAAVFALMAAFTGSMGAAMDTIAGERERRSLVPLLLSAYSRGHLLVGKWLALSLMSMASLVINVTAFSLVLAAPGASGSLLVWMLSAPALAALALLAPAFLLLVSTICRSTKEANTYVSLLVFGIMALAMWIAFRPDASTGGRLLPLLGQQRLLEAGFAGHAGIVALGDLARASVALTGVTALATAAVLALAVVLFGRDDAVHG